MTVYRHVDGQFEEVADVATTAGSARVLVRRADGWEELWPGERTLDPIDTLAPTDVGSDSATLRGDLLELGEAADAECWFRYRLAGSEPVRETAPQTRTDTGPFTATVDGLSSGAAYGGAYDAWALAAVEGTTWAGQIRSFSVA